MYVCIEVPFVKMPMGSGIQLGQGEGPIRLVGPISQPRGTIDTASLTLAHTCALNVCFLNQLYFRQIRVSRGRSGLSTWKYQFSYDH